VSLTTAKEAFFSSMSKYSTLDAQHSALRDLERQRLERMMGQLRREVETKNGPQHRPADPRFQPPRRKSKVEPSHTPPQSGAPISGSSPDMGGDRVQSVEIAWLWRVSNQMDDEADEVNKFLTKHGLDRYAAILANDPGGLGTSLELLRLADDAALEKLGLSAPHRAQLLAALRQELPVSAFVTAGGSTPSSRPRSAASVQPNSAQGSKCATPVSAGRLGKPPPGWHALRTTHDQGNQVTHIPERVDAAIGDDEVGLDDLQIAQTSPTPSPSSPRALPATESQKNSATQSQQITKAGKNSASTGNVCCYQCFKKVRPSSAVEASQEQDTESRCFCSKQCVDAYREAQAAQDARRNELSKLRNLVSSR